MKAHSRGPWRIDAQQVVNAEREAVCEVFAVNGDVGTRYGRGESDANARLIANAPELLTIALQLALLLNATLVDTATVERLASVLPHLSAPRLVQKMTQLASYINGADHGA